MIRLHMDKKLTIKEVRSILGITQEVMGNLMGVESRHISRVETGVRAETKKDVAHLKSLMALHRANLL